MAMKAQPKRPYSKPSFKNRHKRRILQELQMSFQNKAIRNLSSHQLSPIETEVLTLGLNFVPTPLASTHHLVLKLANCLTETMKKQFHFRNQPLITKHPAYCKPSTWIAPEPNSTNLMLFLEQIQIPLCNPHGLQDPISPHNKGPPSKN